jgi:hypothetical protein
MHKLCSISLYLLHNLVMFGGKRGRFASRRTSSQPWSTGVAASCCGGAFAAGGTGALHKIDRYWSGHHKALISIL